MSPHSTIKRCAAGADYFALVFALGLAAQIGFAVMLCFTCVAGRKPEGIQPRRPPVIRTGLHGNPMGVEPEGCLHSNRGNTTRQIDRVIADKIVESMIVVEVTSRSRLYTSASMNAPVPVGSALKMTTSWASIPFKPKT